MPELKVSRWPLNQSLDSRTVAEVWARDGFSCDLWVDFPGQEWLDFVHRTDERVVVKEGSRHSVWNRGSSTARWFYGYRHG
jgi:hypothetical protein